MEKRWTVFLPPVCAVLGVLCLAGAVWAALCLDLEWLQPFGEGGTGMFGPPLGTAGQRLSVAVVLVILAALSLFLLHVEGMDGKTLLIMLLPVGAAILVRALCLNYASGDYRSFLAHWMEFFRVNGGFSAISMSIGDYNVPYLYFLAAISYLDTPDLYLIKLFSILADVLLAWGGFRLVRVLRGGRKEDHAPLIAFVLLLFLPTVVLNGALWGQCDAIYGALALHALALALERKNVPSVILLAVAFSFKLQTIFIMPLWGVLWLARRVSFRELLVFPAAYFVTILPALWLGKPLADILGTYFNQMGEYSRLVLNAPSAFQFVPYNLEADAALLSGIGIGIAFALVLVLLWAGHRLGKWLDDRAVMAAAVVLVIGVPFFLPHMHERYFFLADVVTLCWACVNWKRTPAAVLACGASLASYLVYLRLKYNHVFVLFGFQFVMGLEALAMLAALVFSAAVLWQEVTRYRENGPEGEKNG